MKLKKRLNNNVVVAVDLNGSDQIIMGKGLGFAIAPGTMIDETKIEKIFTLKNSTDNERLQELCKTIPAEHIKLAQEIITYAKINVRNAIQDNVIVALCDHIYMAIERKKQDIEVKNVMLWDIQKFYRDEFAVGQYAVTLIQEQFAVDLNDDEAGFIALHLVNAQLDVKSESIQEITKLMQDIETIVRITCKIAPDVDSVYYYRFITHLKFFAERLFSGKTYKNQDVSNMIQLVHSQYPKEYACAEKIAVFLKEKYGYLLMDEELLYLSIHISRIVQISK